MRIIIVDYDAEKPSETAEAARLLTAFGLPTFKSPNATVNAVTGETNVAPTGGATPEDKAEADAAAKERVTAKRRTRAAAKPEPEDDTPAVLADEPEDTPDEEPEPEEAPAPVKKTPAKADGPSAEDVRTAAVEYLREFGKDQLRKALGEFSATSIGELAPEDFAAFIERVSL